MNFKVAQSATKIYSKIVCRPLYYSSVTKVVRYSGRFNKLVPAIMMSYRSGFLQKKGFQTDLDLCLSSNRVYQDTWRMIDTFCKQIYYVPVCC